jgi:hypothetical protein
MCLKFKTASTRFVNVLQRNDISADGHVTK